MNYLLDTNVVTEIRKRSANVNVVAWVNSVPEHSLFLSVLVVGEIRQGIERLQRRDPAQAAVFRDWLTTLLSTYKDRIVAVTVEIADEWGRLNAPDPLPIIDGLLAATAKVHGWTLVTRNTADVTRTGVALLNPFQVQN